MVVKEDIERFMRKVPEDKKPFYQWAIYQIAKVQNEQIEAGRPVRILWKEDLWPRGVKSWTLWPLEQAGIIRTPWSTRRYHPRELVDKAQTIEYLKTIDIKEVIKRMEELERVV